MTVLQHTEGINFEFGEWPASSVPVFFVERMWMECGDGGLKLILMARSGGKRYRLEVSFTEEAFLELAEKGINKILDCKLEVEVEEP